MFYYYIIVSEKIITEVLKVLLLNDINTKFGLNL